MKKLSDYARELGRKGGKAKSAAKTAACRANAKKTMVDAKKGTMDLFDRQ